MKTLRVTIYIALLFFVNIAVSKCSANIDGTLCAINDQCESMSSLHDCQNSRDNCERVASVSVDDVTDSFVGAVSVLSVGDLLRCDRSELLPVSAYLLEIPGVITVDQVVTAGRVKVIGQAAGSFGMLLVSVFSYFILLNLRKIYSCLVQAAMAGFDCLVLLPVLVRNISLSYVSDEQGVLFVNNIVAEEPVSGRSALTISYAGMLKMLASASAVVLSTLFSVIYCTIDMAQRILLFVCAILFLPVLELVQVTHRSFWESITIRRCVSRYPVVWLGRVRLAAVCSGLEILGLSKSRPGFNTSFAMSSACFNCRLSRVRRGMWFTADRKDHTSRYIEVGSFLFITFLIV